ncbi:MAG: diaminobutyrate--2-oxoglutarate transaminase [Vulcanimicrobiota bacterium]
MEVFNKHESEVRSYCRTFPTVFTRAEGSHLFDEEGRRYLDFFAGAGVLNYGHNHPRLRGALIDYLNNAGISHGLDMATAAKGEFLEKFDRTILQPRGLNYKVQFPGPTGTNAVEAALKLARKVTGRHSVVCFTNSFHGMTLGSLSVTGNSFKRNGAGVPLHYAVPMPFGGYFGDGVDTLDYLESYLDNLGSGLDLPAAIILETVQAEGGVNVASFPWLRRLASLAKQHGILLVVDDIQVGCGRTGTFFSFEDAGIKPDIVCLSKAISGYGLPMALVLIKPEHDCWKPGEHNGTFRGNNLAFVTATAALDFWQDENLARQVTMRSARLRQRLEGLAARFPEARAKVRGRGLIMGFATPVEGLAKELSRRNFEAGLITETAGPEDQVLKFLPPLTIDEASLDRGLDIVEDSLTAAVRQPALV